MTDRWTPSKPRTMLSSRIREEYREGLEASIAEGRAEGMTALQRYDVLEYLLRDLLTTQGRAKVRQELRALVGRPIHTDRWTRPNPRALLSSRIREEYREGLEAIVAEGRAEGMTALQKYDVLEYLLRDLLTTQGRTKVRQELRRTE